MWVDVSKQTQTIVFQDWSTVIPKNSRLNIIEDYIFTLESRCKRSLLSKIIPIHDIALRNQLSIIFTDFLHMFTFFKLVGSCRKKFFGKSDFFPKIPNFCRIGLAPAKTYWMIMSPQKRVKKIPTICTCQTFIYYVNLLKTNFEVIFKTHFRAKKISKIIMDQ